MKSKVIGDVLFTSHPHAHVVSSGERGKRCDECLIMAGDLKRCSACHAARYCSTLCQKRAWSFHKEECKCFQRVAPKLPLDNVLLFYRLLLRHERGENTNIKVDYLGKNRCFDDLMSHEEDIKNDQKRMEEFTELCSTLHMFVGEDYSLPNPDSLLSMYCKMVINTFTICCGEMQPVGAGIYLGPSVLDHSCAANTVAVFHGTELQLRATEAIAAHEVEQVFISYIDLLASTTDRQTQLEQQYYFTCHCCYCDDEERDELLTAAQCPASGCTAPVHQNPEGKFIPCQVCNRSHFPKDYGQQIEAATAAATALLTKCKKWRVENDAATILSECTEFLDGHGCLLHAQNVYRVQIVDRLFDACIDLKHWEKAMAYGRCNTDPYSKVYSDFHPNRGIHFMKLGKILLFQEELKEALANLEQAQRILRVTHGREHTLFQDVQTLLNQCEEEMRVKLEANEK